MTEQNLTERAEIKKCGILRGPISPQYTNNWIQQLIPHDSAELANLAQDMGYEVGDKVKYKIIIEPKS